MIVIKFDEFLFEGSNRKKNLDKIDGMRDVIFEHCFKIYRYIDSTYVDGWKDEIVDFMNTVYGYDDNFGYDILYKKLTFKIMDEYDNIDTKIMRNVDYIVKSVDKKCGDMYIYRDDIYECLRLYNKFVSIICNNYINKKYKNNDYNCIEILSEIFDIS